MMRFLLAYLPSWQFFAVVIDVIDVGGEGLEVWDDELLPEGLSQQDNVALDTPDTRNIIRNRSNWNMMKWRLFRFQKENNHTVFLLLKKVENVKMFLDGDSVSMKLKEWSSNPQTIID